MRYDSHGPSTCPKLQKYRPSTPCTRLDQDRVPPSLSQLYGSSGFTRLGDHGGPAVGLSHPSLAPEGTVVSLRPAVSL